MYQGAKLANQASTTIKLVRRSVQIVLLAFHQYILVTIAIHILLGKHYHASAKKHCVIGVQQDILRINRVLEENVHYALPVVI